MTFKQMFTSSVGKKLIMGFTGIFLILFLIVHAGLNATIWANDGGLMFNKAGHFMGSNAVPRILEIGLFLGIFLHIYQGYLLTLENRSKRSVGYAVSYSKDEPEHFIFLDPPYRGSFTSYGQEFSDDDQNKLLDYVRSNKNSDIFLCNRDIEDGFYDNTGLVINKFPVTYTAGRRKKTEDGFEAKPATELLIRNK
jgi:hypothetical protein